MSFPLCSTSIGIVGFFLCVYSCILCNTNLLNCGCFVLILKKKGPVNWHGVPVSMGTLVPNLSRHARDRAKGHAACRCHLLKKKIAQRFGTGCPCLAARPCHLRWASFRFGRLFSTSFSIFFLPPSLSTRPNPTSPPSFHSSPPSNPS